jgi:outer membrane receptor protein involved in Fe transport
MAQAAYGQAKDPAGTAPDAKQQDTGEIIVTAQKRAERLRDVGMTITAASEAQLKSAGVASALDLPKISPGLTVAPTFAGAYVFSIRGIGFNATQLSAPPAVSVYLNEAPIPYSAMYAGVLLDVERVEVLKGPQGTLFGQNSTGGSINVIAAKPTSVLSAGGFAEVNNFGQVMAEGFVSGPITNNLRARFAATTTQFGPWQRSIRGDHKSNGDENKLFGRATLEWTPTDALKITGTLNGGYDHGEVIQPQVSIVAPVTPANTPPGLINYPLPTNARDVDYSQGIDTHRKNSQYQGILRADLQVSDSASLTSLTSYIHTKIYEPRDFDGNEVPGVQGSTEGVLSSFNQEIRLSGSFGESRVKYVVGANYQKDNIRDRLVEKFAQYSSLPPGFLLDSEYKLTNRALGAFGNVDVKVLPGLTLTGGVRYTATKQTVNGCNYGNATTGALLGFIADLLRPGAGAAYANGGCIVINNVGPNPDYLPVVANLSQKENNVSWRAGANYKPNDDSLIYGLVSRGYKSGVFPVGNILLQSGQAPVTQEKLTEYEVGVKLQLMNRMVGISAAGFYYDYKNKQFFTYFPVPPIGVTAVLVNIPKSKVSGLEGEITLRPVSSLTLRGAATYIKTTIGNYNGFNGIGQPVNFKGSEFNFSPPWSATFDAEYRIPVSDNQSIFAGLGGLYNSRTYADLGENPLFKVPARMILDARIGIESKNGWHVTAFVRNLTNKYYWLSVNNGGDVLTRNPGMPRTFGINAGHRF